MNFSSMAKSLLVVIAVSSLPMKAANAQDASGDPNIGGGGATSGLILRGPAGGGQVVDAGTQPPVVETRFEQSRSGADKGFAPIGIIKPINEIPVRLPNGQMINTTAGRATATLVSPCYIIANYHAVYGETTGPIDETPEHHQTKFFVGDDPVTGFSRQAIGTPVAHGNYSIHGSPQEDWAVLKLDKCYGADKTIGWMDIAKVSWRHYVNPGVNLVGYPVDHTGKKLWSSTLCRGVSDYGSDGALVDNCQATGGDSGAIGVARQRDGNLVGVFMEKGGDRNDFSINLSVLMSNPKISKLIGDDIANWGVENASHFTNDQPTQLAHINTTNTGS